MARQRELMKVPKEFYDTVKAEAERQGVDMIALLQCRSEAIASAIKAQG